MNFARLTPHNCFAYLLGCKDNIMFIETIFSGVVALEL